MIGTPKDGRPENEAPSPHKIVRMEGAKVGVARLAMRRKWFGGALLAVPAALTLIGQFVHPQAAAPGEFYDLNALLPGWWPSLLLGGIFLGVASLIGWFASVGQRGPVARRAATVEVHADTLRLKSSNGELAIALDDIGHVVDLGDETRELVLHLRDGRQVTIGLQKGGRGELLEALRPRVEARAGRVVIGGAATTSIYLWVLCWFGFLAAAISSLAALGALGSALDAARGLAFTNLLWPAGSAALATIMWQTLRRRSVVVASDGVRLERLRTRFIGYDEIIQMKEHANVLRLYLRSGETIALPAAAMMHNYLTQRLRTAKQAFDDATAAAPLAAITRGTRNADEWQSALRKVAEPGYRVGAVHSDQLTRILDDPAAAPEQRIGAALALTAKQEPRKRIRIAAQACAEPAMRRALEAAAEGELADEELQRANQRFERSMAAPSSD